VGAAVTRPLWPPVRFGTRGGRARRDVICTPVARQGEQREPPAGDDACAGSIRSTSVPDRKRLGAAP
jgi:hypothetical protein